MINDGSILENIDPYKLLSDGEMDIFEEMLVPLIDWIRGKVESCIATIFPDAYMISTNYTPDGRLEIMIAGYESPISEHRLSILAHRLGVDVTELLPSEMTDGCVLVASPRVKSDADKEC